MKKNRVKQALCTALSVAMLVGLTACGGGGGAGSDGPGGSGGIGGSGGGGGKNSANAALAKECVWRAADIDLDFGTDDYNIMCSDVSGEHIYMVARMYNYSETGANDTLTLVSMKTDGSDIRRIELGRPESTLVLPEDGGQGSAPGTGEVDGGFTVPVDDDDVSPDISDDELPDVDDDMAEKYPDGAPGYYRYVGFNRVMFLPDGGGVAGLQQESYNDYNTGYSVVNFTLCKWDMQGNLLWTTPVDVIRDDEQGIWQWVENMIPGGSDGSILLWITGEGYDIVTISPEGEVSGSRRPADNLQKILDNGASFQNMGNGRLAISFWNENWTKMYLADWNPETDELGDPIEMPGSMVMNGFDSLTVGGGYDLVYSTSGGIFGLNQGETEARKLLDYVNSDLPISYVNQIVFLDDETIFAVYNNSTDYRPTFGIFRYVDPATIPDKAVMVLGGVYLEGDVRNQVMKFNKESEKYRIVLRDYNVYNTEEDYQGGLTQLNTDIIAGNMPDILIYYNSLPINSYISKGLFADIGELIAADEELSQAEFMDNVLDAYRVNGKLYFVFPAFSVSTVIAKKSLVGDRTGWTISDMQEVMSRMPPEAEAFREMTRNYFMNLVMSYCGSDFVDLSTGKCDFDSENFIAMLQYARTLPENLDEDYYGEDFWENYSSQYRDNRTLMMQVGISRIQDLNYTLNGFFGGDVSYIGFPTESGQGSTVSMSGRSYCIYSKSACKEGAWEFLRTLLTKEYQDTSLYYGLPIRKDSFLKKAQEARERPYWLNENGDKEYYDEEFSINGDIITLAPMTQEQIDQVVEFIGTVNKADYYNSEVQNIIFEEVEAFFAGQKSAQEVADIIQRRVKLYVNENM